MADPNSSSCICRSAVSKGSYSLLWSYSPSSESFWPSLLLLSVATLVWLEQLWPWYSSALSIPSGSALSAVRGYEGLSEVRG